MTGAIAGRLNKLVGLATDPGRVSRINTNSHSAWRQRGVRYGRSTHCTRSTTPMTTEACQDARQSQAKNPFDSAKIDCIVRIPFFPTTF